MQLLKDANLKANTLNRGIMIDLARVPERPDYVISLLPFLASCSINQLYFNLENKLEYKNYQSLKHSCAWSQEDMNSVIIEAEKYSIEVVPIPSTIGHMESILKHKEFAHLAEPCTADHLAIYKTAARDFIGNILDELCRLFPGDYIHLAGDEAPYLGKNICEDNILTVETLVKCYADGVNFMAARVRSHGKRAIIWADMVLHYPQLMEWLDRDIVLIDWNYGRLDKEELTTPERLMASGFDVGVAGGILADEPFLPLLDRLEKNLPYISRRTGIWGVINCIWEPRTQTLPVTRIGIAVAGACSWNSFGIDHDNILSDASEQVYGIDISAIYRLLATGDLFELMMETKMCYYHVFEFSCSHPAVHLAEKIDSRWQNIYDRMESGLYLLSQAEEFKKKYPEDYLALKACGMLGKSLAGFVLYMQDIDCLESPRKLRKFARFLQETLECQRAAWSTTRFSHDENFDWWFVGPFEYKIACIEKLADEIEHGKDVDHEMLVFNVNKGDAETWNLLRIKILFSDTKTDFTQMFFKTVPLWMANDVSFSLMPEEHLPKYVKIEFNCWTWHNPEMLWTQILSWKIVKKTLKHPAAITVTNKQYEVEYIGNDGILLKLVGGGNAKYE